MSPPPAVKESGVVVQALRLNTLSKLTFADCVRFDALVRDVFPGVDFRDVEQEALSAALEAVLEEARLEAIPSQVRLADSTPLLRSFTFGSSKTNVFF